MSLIKFLVFKLKPPDLVLLHKECVKVIWRSTYLEQQQWSKRIIDHPIRTKNSATPDMMLDTQVVLCRYAANAGITSLKSIRFKINLLTCKNFSLLVQSIYIQRGKQL